TRLMLQALLMIELLLACAEDELCTTLTTCQRFVLVHGPVTLLKLLPSPTLPRARHLACGVGPGEKPPHVSCGHLRCRNPGETRAPGYTIAQGFTSMGQKAPVSSGGMNGRAPRQPDDLARIRRLVGFLWRVGQVGHWRVPCYAGRQVQ